MKNSKLFIYPSGLFLEDNINPGSWVNECSINIDIESMSDTIVTQHVLLCNEYGFNPEIIMSSVLKMT